MLLCYIRIMPSYITITMPRVKQAKQFKKDEEAFVQSQIYLNNTTTYMSVIYCLLYDLDGLQTTTNVRRREHSKANNEIRSFI